jgi:hypothetical protein
MSYFIVLFLVGWLALSVAAQVRGQHLRSARKILGRIRDYDYCSMIPSWSFFAPNPGTRDFQLMYRDKLLDGQFTVWKSVQCLSYPYLRFVWNPHKRRAKAIVDLCVFLMGDLKRVLEAEAPEKAEALGKSIYISLPYIGLATYISRVPHSPFSDFTQFMIATSYGFDTDKPPEIAFISPLYRLQELASAA